MRGFDGRRTYAREVQIDRRLVADLIVGDLVLLEDDQDWVVVEAVCDAVDGSLTVTTSQVVDGQRRTQTLPGATVVRRGEPGALHDADEFVGLPIVSAQAWAAALGWAFRNQSEDGFSTSDLRHDRVNVWTDPDGVVTRAELF